MVRGLARGRGHRFLSGFEPFTFLPCFTPAETEGLVRLGLEPNATVLKGVYEATGGHPYFAQAVCHKMFDGESNIDTAKERVYLEFRSLIDGILNWITATSPTTSGGS